MNIEIELPDLGDEAGEQAIVSEWHFDEGDTIEEGDELLEVVTDTATVEIPSPVSGILIDKLVDVEELVRVGDPIAVVEIVEESGPDLDEEGEI